MIHLKKTKKIYIDESWINMDVRQSKVRCLAALDEPIHNQKVLSITK